MKSRPELQLWSALRNPPHYNCPPVEDLVNQLLANLDREEGFLCPLTLIVVQKPSKNDPSRDMGVRLLLAKQNPAFVNDQSLGFTVSLAWPTLSLAKSPPKLSSR